MESPVKPETIARTNPPVVLTTQARADLACERLTLNRKRLAAWLDQIDRQEETARTPSAGLTDVLWPMLKGLGSSPVTSMAITALAQGWVNRHHQARDSRPAETNAMGAVWPALRRHPKTTLFIAAAVSAAMLYRFGYRRHP
ncbi:MAG: hypothetical protein PWQ61_1708 [Betaproteobacteria bacterium]|jgi:hypothetical protein|nr:hypothetical protein [Betaproteobacteria bacterium]